MLPALLQQEEWPAGGYRSRGRLSYVCGPLKQLSCHSPTQIWTERTALGKQSKEPLELRDNAPCIVETAAKQTDRVFATAPCPSVPILASICLGRPRPCASFLP